MVDEIRIQAVKSHPLMETACRCVEQCDVDVIKDVVSIVVDLIKRAVGTLTKVCFVYFNFFFRFRKQQLSTCYWNVPCIFITQPLT